MGGKIVRRKIYWKFSLGTENQTYTILVAVDTLNENINYQAKFELLTKSERLQFSCLQGKVVN